MDDLTTQLQQLEQRAFDKIKSGECTCYHEVANIMLPVQRAMRAINQAYIMVGRANNELASVRDEYPQAVRVRKG